MRSPYEVLGLPDGASAHDVRKAYRKLALRYHPDRNSEPGAGEAFIRITQAYDEIMEKRKPLEANFSAFDAISVEMLRRRQRRERAERMSQLRYEEFLAEINAVKSSRYYYLIAAGIFIFLASGFGIALSVAMLPFYISIQLKNPGILLYEIFSLPAGILLAFGVYHTYIYLKPYIRQKSEHYDDKFSFSDVLAIFDIKKRPIRISWITFAKLALLLPIILSLATIADYLIPRTQVTEPIKKVELKDERYSMSRYFTYHSSFRAPDSITFAEGDSVTVRFTRIFNIATSIKSHGYQSKTNNGEMYSPMNSIYMLSVFLPLLLLFLSLFGFLSDNSSEISAGLFISYAMLYIGYFYLSA
jgi:hypothetical protein